MSTYKVYLRHLRCVVDLPESPGKGASNRTIPHPTRDATACYTVEAVRTIESSESFSNHFRTIIPRSPFPFFQVPLTYTSHHSHLDAMVFSKDVVELQLATKDPNLCRDKAVKLLKEGKAELSVEW